jgi:superkiller protein 3
MVNILDKKAIEKTVESEYESLIRALRRRKGFGLLFVESTPVGGEELINKIKKDLPQKKVDVLSLENPITNLIERVTAFPNQETLNILFITGLEKSLVQYIRPGYGGKGDYYKLDTIPPILSHLNWQRENFRDRFRHICFVFILPKYAIKYILLRAPDFFDWGSGKIQIVTERSLVEQEARRLWWDGTVEKYQQWTPRKRLERLAEIHTYLEENLDLEEKFNLYYEQALILHVNGDYEEAIAAYDQALKIKSDDHEVWSNRGIALGNLGRYEEAIASYDEALKFKPDYHQAWYKRGITLGNLGRFEEAITSYDEALKFKPDYHEAWNKRGIALSQLGRLEEAIASFDEALKIKPDDHDNWYARGVVLGNLGRLEEAIASYDQALKIKPDKHEAWYNRGIALDNLGRLEEAIASYDQALKIKSDYPDAWNNRGIALGNLGRLEEAIASFDHALKIKPDDHSAWNGRGAALGNLGRLEEAIASIDHALKLKPDDPYAYYNKACAYALQENIDIAIENLKQAINLDSQSLEDAKTNSDFDKIRNDSRFIDLINSQNQNSQ